MEEGLKAEWIGEEGNILLQNKEHAYHSSMNTEPTDGVYWNEVLPFPHCVYDMSESHQTDSEGEHWTNLKNMDQLQHHELLTETAQ